MNHESKMNSHPTVLIITLLAALGVNSMPLHAQSESDFGSMEYSRTALIGMLYDFKQTQQREHIPMDYKKYYAEIERFIKSDYDESMLRKYYRATNALYATQIFLPHRLAGDAPKAFGVEKIVKPKYWLIHYKGQVISPQAGEYQFAATADGFIILAVNGKTLLIKHNSNNDKYLKQFGAEMGYPAGRSLLRYSLPFVADGKTPLDLDILLGDAGGEFNAFLLYRNNDAKNSGPLPVFQLIPAGLPDGRSTKAVTLDETWKSIP
jgi:hypothetical protein